MSANDTHAWLFLRKQRFSHLQHDSDLVHDVADGRGALRIEQRHADRLRRVYAEARILNTALRATAREPALRVRVGEFGWA
eukprot:3613362-Pleurochrysis_carterae.AAC.1